VLLNPPGGNYEPGTTVSATAIAGLNYQFKIWEGNVPVGHESDNPVSIVMDGPKTITAVFEEKSSCGLGAGMPLAVGLLFCSVMVIRRRWS
jgi:hypothetical protein